jgi:hypothetical protein
VGTSNWQNISHCVGMLRRLMPQSVLDVGTGFGRWGVLCREFLDAWEGREARALWKVRIEGIEAFPTCLTPVHGYVYDRIHIGDAVDLLPTLGPFDVIYLGDVVEHQTKPRAWALLDAAVRQARQAAIVTIPIGDNWPQDVGIDGNWFHAHRSAWQLEDFDRYPDATRQCFSDYHGRLFLVVEIPGLAGTQPLPVAPAATHTSRSTGQMAVGESAGPSSIDGLLARVDENLSCRGLVDDDQAEAELCRTLLWQVPASAEIRHRLNQLEAESLPWVPSVVSMVDAVYAQLTAFETSRSSDIRGLAPSPESLAVLDRLATALASLAVHLHGHAQVMTSLREIQAELQAVKTASFSDLLATGSTSRGRQH